MGIDGHDVGGQSCVPATVQTHGYLGRPVLWFHSQVIIGEVAAQKTLGLTERAPASVVHTDNSVLWDMCTTHGLLQGDMVEGKHPVKGRKTKCEARRHTHAVNVSPSAQANG
jgi:hypothetical protein